MKRFLIVTTLLLALLVTAAQCGGASAPETEEHTAANSDGQIMVMDPWSRPSPMTQGNGAVYMTLMNSNEQDDVLLSVETDAAEVVELHETTMDGDIMKMSPIPNVKIPAGGSASLEPGGKHVMLINLKQELKTGEKISLTLNFENAGPMKVEAEIRETGAEMDHSNMDMDNNN